MEQTNKPKAKRKLKSLDFSGSDAAVALVGPCVGGPANQIPTLVIKAATQFSDEFLEKASKVRVEMDIVEYLARFFSVYGADAEILARSLGYTTPGMEKAALEAKEEMLEDQEPPEYPYFEEPGDKKFERYVESKVASIEVMKQLYEAENMTDVLANLSEEQYLQFLVDQQNIEKAFKKIDAEKENKSKAKPKVKTKVVGQDKKTESVEKSAEDVTSVASEVISEDKPSVVTKNKEKKSMTQEVQVIEQTTEVEMIAKSQFDSIQKQLQEKQVELQKALDLVKKYETEKKEAIAKSRKEQLDKACGKYAEVIFKACGEVEDGLFAEVVKALSEMQEQVEKSAMFQEMGASVDNQETTNESPIAKALQARLSKQQKQ